MATPLFRAMATIDDLLLRMWRSTSAASLHRPAKDRAKSAWTVSPDGTLTAMIGGGAGMVDLFSGAISIHMGSAPARAALERHATFQRKSVACPCKGRGMEAPE